MFGWLLASMSGLTRSATRATRPCAPRDRGDAIELAGGFGVDGADASRDRVLELVARLADAGEDDVRRREARALRDRDLAAGVRIGAAAERAQQAYDRQRRVRLQRVMDRVRVRCERVVDGAIRFADRARAVDVGRRARVYRRSIGC